MHASYWVQMPAVTVEKARVATTGESQGSHLSKDFRSSLFTVAVMIGAIKNILAREISESYHHTMVVMISFDLSHKCTASRCI